MLTALCKSASRKPGHHQVLALGFYAQNLDWECGAGKNALFIERLKSFLFAAQH
jgi:hypothetical protein